MHASALTTRVLLRYRNLLERYVCRRVNENHTLKQLDPPQLVDTHYTYIGSFGYCSRSDSMLSEPFLRAKRKCPLRCTQTYDALFSTYQERRGGFHLLHRSHRALLSPTSSIGIAILLQVRMLEMPTWSQPKRGPMGAAAREPCRQMVNSC